MSVESLPSGPDVLAIAFVVESSLTIVAEWRFVITDYVAPVLKRLGDANPGYRLRIAFVTYATARTVPSPLLCRRFFTEYPAVLREMREDPTKLGIGQTNSGGSQGMAALEGLVAAIELFDVLHTSAQPARPYVNHIFHVAASAPDASIHPQWNEYPLLDSVTWEGLPSELKTRNINISSINLHRNLPRFADLHLEVAQGSKDLPWFPVRHGHTVLLGGLPVPPQKSAKRAGEAHPVERTPDSKRPRLTSQSNLETSPKTVAPNTPSIVPKPSPVPPPGQIPSHISSQPSQPPAQPWPLQTHSLPPNPTPASHYQTLVTSAHTLQDQLRNLQIMAQNARSTNNTAVEQSVMQEIRKKVQMYQKIGQTLRKLQSAASQSQSQSQNQSQNQSNQGQAQMQGQGQGQPSQPPVGATTSLPITLGTLHSPQPASNDVPPSTHFGTDGRLDQQQMLAQFMNRQPLSNPSTGPPGVVPSAARRTISASATAQMQKVMEQTRPDGIPNQGLGGSGPGPGPGQSLGVAGAGQQEHTQSVSSLVEGLGKPSHQWQGSLTWGGTHPSGEKKEVTVYVVANAPNNEGPVKMLPPAMALVPIRSVPMSDMQPWLARSKPVMCSFTPQMHGVPDVQANVANLKSLVALLNSKNIYASASWTRPAGGQGINAIFFPTPQGLIGAISPLTGLPELPKPSNISGLPPELIARMQQMPPEEKELVRMQLRKHREGATMNQGTAAAGVSVTGGSSNNPSLFGSNLNVSQNQLQQQSDFGGAGSGGLSTFGSANTHPSNTYSGLNIMNTMGMGLGQSQNMMGLSATLPRPVSVSGGSVQSGVGVGIGPGNVSYEIMKSFSQRGGNMGGQGPG